MGKKLNEEFSVEVDDGATSGWNQITREFVDANLYQTHSFDSVCTGGNANVSHIVLKRHGRVAAAAQARIIKVRPFGIGIAYIRWGPLWRTHPNAADDQVFRQAVRAIRNEFANRRRMIVRLLPHLPEDETQPYRRILQEEGYVWKSGARKMRTILMDIRPSLDELFNGLDKKWRNCLTNARKQNLELVDGEEDALFQSFEPIYLEMKDRKKFESSSDPAVYREIQRKASPEEKMRVFLCKADGEVCAGAICSALGNTGIYLFGATTARGMKNNGSYLLQWRVLEWLKDRGCEWYNLNGINPEKNEGTYRFKARLAGKHGHDVYFLGQYDAYPNAAAEFLVEAGEYIKEKISTGRESLRDFSIKRRKTGSPVTGGIDKGDPQSTAALSNQEESGYVRSGS